MLVAKKLEALDTASRNKQSLLSECEKMREDYEKLNRLHSMNLTFHRKHINTVESDMQSMTVDHNDLKQQFRVTHLATKLEKEEYEKQIANQRTVVFDTDEENKSFPHLPIRITSRMNNRAVGSS